MKQFLAWEGAPDGDCTISEQQIQVWYVDLDTFSEQKLDEVFVWLAEDEKKRAQRFHFEKDRKHFIAARSTLRKLLGQYLQCTPQQVQFHYGAHGKPAVADPTLQFNLSHSQNIALYAFTRKHLIGIDVETLEKTHDIDGIAQRFFSAREYAVLKSLPAAEKKLAFFNAWTRKEAFLKAIGQGLSYSLANVEVTLLPGETPTFTALHDAQQNVKEWSLYTLPPITGYAAALAVKGKVETIKTFI